MRASLSTAPDESGSSRRAGCARPTTTSASGKGHVRRLAAVLFIAVTLAACSSSIPRHAAVYSPPLPTASEQPSVGSLDSSAPLANPPADGSPPASAPAVDTSGWVTLAPAGEGFSVLMPGAAKTATATASTPAGNAPVTIWTHTDSSNAGFQAIHVKFKAGTFSKAPTKSVLDGAMNQEIATVPGAVLKSQSDMTLAGHPGRLIMFATSKTTWVAEFCVAGDDMYAFDVMTDAGKADAGRTQAFFATIQITA